MRRIWTRGIRNANKFVLGAAIAYNLKKWLKWQDINKSLTGGIVSGSENQNNEQNKGVLNTCKASKNQKSVITIFLN